MLPNSPSFVGIPQRPELARVRSPRAPFPSRWLLPSVHQGDDCNDTRIDAVEDGIGKPVDEFAADITVDERVGQGAS